MILFSNFVLLGAFVFIVTIISAPLLYSRWRANFKTIPSRSPTAQPSLLSEFIPKPTPSALERGSIPLTSTSRLALILPFALLKLFPRPANYALHLASDPSINTHSSSPNIEASTGIAQEPMTTRPEISVRTLRRLRRQGWLVHLSSRELAPLRQRLSFSPTLNSSATVLSDIGNTHRDITGDSVEQIFSPQIIEHFAGGLYCDPPNTPTLYPVSPFLNSPIPLLVLTSTAVKNNTGLEYVDYSSVVHAGSPLGPSFLNFTLPSVLACSEEGSACEANNMHRGESELGDGTSDSLSEFLDKFPSPPPVDSVIESCEAPASPIRKENLALMSPVHAEMNITREQEREQKTTTTAREHETVDNLQENAEYRPGCHNERIKASRSESILRTFPVRDHVHHSFSMPFGFGMVSSELDARGLGFFSYNYVSPVKG